MVVDNYQEIRIKINKMYRILCSVLALFFVIGTFVAYKVYVGNVCIEHELGRFTLLFIVGNWIIFSFLAFIETAIHSSECVSYAIALVLEMLLNIGLYIFLYIHVFTTKTVLNFIFSLIIFLFVSILQVVIAGLYYWLGVWQKQDLYEELSIDIKKERDKDIKGNYKAIVEKYNLMNERIEAIAEKIDESYDKDKENLLGIPEMPVYDIHNIGLLHCKGVEKYKKYKNKCKKLRERCETRHIDIKKWMENAEKVEKAFGDIVSNRDETYRNNILRNEIKPAFKLLKKGGKKLKNSRNRFKTEIERIEKN